MHDSIPVPQNRSERDALTNQLAQRLSQLADNDQICFGRLDYSDEHAEPGGTFHIGRLAVTDQNHDPVIVDWRAPIAAAFYQATPGNPHGVERRRHITVRERRVIALNDQTFDGHPGQTAGETSCGSGARSGCLVSLRISWPTAIGCSANWQRRTTTLTWPKHASLSWKLLVTSCATSGMG